MPKPPSFTLPRAIVRTATGDRWLEFRAVGEGNGGKRAVAEDSLLERVTAAGEERHLSQNTLTAYRRTWLKLIAWSTAEGLFLQTLPAERAGEFYQGSFDERGNKVR